VKDKSLSGSPAIVSDVTFKAGAKMAKGKELFMQSLLAAGVRYIFGNPGTTEAALLDALADYPEIEYVLALHEGVAVGMADAYAFAAGRPAVVNLHAAPGLGNGLGMLYDALQGRSPILVTAGQPDNRLRLRGPLLGHDLVAMAAPLTKWSATAQRADDIPLLLRRAFKIATEPPTGPVFVDLPANVMEEEGEQAVLPPSRLFYQNQPDPAAVEKAAGLLLGAQRPVIICGDGVFRSRAQSELVALAELLGAPVWNTLLTSAVNFPSTHPQLRGELPDNHAQIRELLGEPDVALLVGGHFFREVFYTPVSPWPRETAVIQIDEAPEALARNFAVNVGLAADPRQALHDLQAVISSRVTEAFWEASQSRRGALAKLKEEMRRQQQARLEAGWNEEPMTSARFMAELNEALPKDVIVVGEVNTCRDDLLRTVPFEHPGDYYGSRGGGIGQGLPGALGVRLAHPDRPLVAVSGDGSALYSIQALWTAAHYRMPIVFIILNNREYRIVKHNMDRHREFFDVTGKRGYPFLDLTEPDVDFVDLAQGFGVPARRVFEADELGPVLQEALSEAGPFLLDVPVESDCGVLADEE
jgi:benzoylformate decarboxylase